MSKEAAVRYLLLLHLSKRFDVLSFEALREIARSLKVSSAGERFQITWIKQGEAGKTFILKEQFNLFSRGDLLSPDIGSNSSETVNTSNATSAECIIEQITGFASRAVRKSISLSKIGLFPLLLFLTLSAPFLFLGQVSWVLWLALAFLCLSDYIYRYGKLVHVIPLGLFYFVAPGIAFWFALVLVIISWSDPDPLLRRIRIILFSFSAIVSGLLSTFPLTLVAIALIPLAVALMMFHYVRIALYRVFPLLSAYLLIPLAFQEQWGGYWFLCLYNFLFLLRITRKQGVIFSI